MNIAAEQQEVCRLCGTTLLMLLFTQEKQRPAGLQKPGPCVAITMDGRARGLYLHSKPLVHPVNRNKNCGQWVSAPIF